MSPQRIFDFQHYERLNASRGTTVSILLSELVKRLNLRTALDVGCGLGHFSGLLRSLGFEVSAVDGRQGNVEEARRRFPQIEFRHVNAEDFAMRSLGKFDLIVCFGLLYHLENPMLAIRHLHALTGELLLIESVIFPGQEPIMALVDEGGTEDQGLNQLAFYPTEACLVKMFYRSGFSDVYELRTQPDHPEYAEGNNRRRTRTMLVAAVRPIDSDLLNRLTESSTPIVPWDPANTASEADIFQKLRLRIGGRPQKEK